MSIDASQQEPDHPARLRPVTTLAHLLDEPTLRLSCVEPGGSLQVPVRWIHSTELLDPAPYLRGGELVCTVGSSLRTESDARALVTAVRGSGAAGICFGIGDVHTDVPATLRTACAEAQLPLLSAPLGVPFMAIGEYVAERRAEAEGVLHLSEQRLLAELLAAVRAGASVQALLDQAADTVGGRWEFEAEGTVYRSGGAAGVLTTAVRSDDGLSLTWSGVGDPPEQELLLSVARLLEVCRHEEDLGGALRRERVGELLTLVFERLALPAALDGSLAAAGLDPERLVFSVWPSGAGRLLEARLRGRPVVIGESPRDCILVSGESLPIEETANRLGLACGHSRVVALTEAALAIREARAGFDLGQRHGGVITPGDLTTLEGLLAQQPVDRLTPFVDRLLEPLLRSDSTRGTGYLPTLRTYFDTGASLVETARREFLHVNTVRHRLEQVRVLSGRDPFALGERVDLMIAVWALDHLGR